MGATDRERERRELIATLIRLAHEQSSASPEPAPFWREGPWRCEYHSTTEQPRLKVFSGERCVHEEPVPGKAAADARSRELRRTIPRRFGGTDTPF